MVTEQAFMLNAESVSNKAREMCDSKFVQKDFLCAEIAK